MVCCLLLEHDPDICVCVLHLWKWMRCHDLTWDLGTWDLQEVSCGGHKMGSRTPTCGDCKICFNYSNFFHQRLTKRAVIPLAESQCPLAAVQTSVSMQGSWSCCGKFHLPKSHVRSWHLTQFSKWRTQPGIWECYSSKTRHNTLFLGFSYTSRHAVCT